MNFIKNCFKIQTSTIAPADKADPNLPPIISFDPFVDEAVDNSNNDNDQKFVSWSEPAISKKEDETTNLPEIINNSKPLSRRQSMKIINRRTMKSLMRDLKPIIHENKKLRSITYLSEKPYPHHLFDGRSSSGTKVLEEELAKYKEENSFLQEKIDSRGAKAEARRKDLALLAEIEADMSDEEEDVEVKRRREIREKALKEAAELDYNPSCFDSDDSDNEERKDQNLFDESFSTMNYYRKWDDIEDPSDDEEDDLGGFGSPGKIIENRERLDYRYKRRSVEAQERLEVREEIKHVNICVIGAGITGLTTARELALYGYNVTVLEASTRIGGRILTKTVKQGINLDEESVGMGAPPSALPTEEPMSPIDPNRDDSTDPYNTQTPTVDVDLGAEWFHRVRHLQVVRECERYGLEIETPTYQKRWLYWDRDVLGIIEQDSHGEHPVATKEDDDDLKRVLNIINEDSSFITFGGGYAQQAVLTYDIAFTRYVSANLKPRPIVAKFLYSRAFMLSTGTDPALLSTYNFLHTIRGFGCAEEAFFSRLSRIKGGFERLTDKIYDHILKLGVKVVTQSPVSNITVPAVQPGFYDGRYRPRYGCMVLNDEIVITTAHGHRYVCAGCIMSVPMSNISSMRWTPSLPVDLTYAATKVNVSRLLKSISMCRNLALDTEHVNRVRDTTATESYTIEYDQADNRDLSNLFADSASLVLTQEMDPFVELTPHSLTPSRQHKGAKRNREIEKRFRDARETSHPVQFTESSIAEDVNDNDDSIENIQEDGSLQLEPLRSSNRRDGLVAFSRLWDMDPFGPANSPEKRAGFKQEATEQLKFHHPHIEVESIAAHNFAGDPWFRNSGFALRAGTAQLFGSACDAAKEAFGSTVPFLFCGADFSLDWTGWVQGGLSSAFTGSAELHARCYKIPVRKLFNQTRRLFRKKGKNWDSEVVKVVYD